MLFSTLVVETGLYIILFYAFFCELYHLQVYLAKMKINLAQMKFNLAQMKFKLTFNETISCFLFAIFIFWHNFKKFSFLNSYNMHVYSFIIY